MSFSIYDAAIPPTLRMLDSLSKILDKAVKHCEERKIAPADLLEARFAADMFPFTRQIQTVSDTSKGLAARLAGIDPPSMPDTETTFPELKARLARTIDFVKSVAPEKFKGAEDRTVTIKFPQGEMSFTGRDFVTFFALPNLYFHASTAYDLLRQKGVEVGKRDYLGA
ncbi:MAG TPA: DUF1993 domain-containing protein [Rhizomicrobium sp.]|jgi:hypothetical protein